MSKWATAADGKRRNSRIGHTAALARLTPFVMCALLGVAVVCSLIALVSHPAASAVSRQPVDVGTGPAGFAESYVAKYVAVGSGGEAALRVFFPNAPDFEGVKNSARYAARTSAIAVKQLSTDYWSITVAVDVLGTNGSQVSDLGMRAYSVGVYSSNGGMVATALPAEVSFPAAAKVPQTQFGDVRPPGGEPALEESIQGFLTAYLTNSGDLERYVSPGNDMASATPSPCALVELVGLAVAQAAPGAQVRDVLTRSACTDAAGNVELLEYPLRLAQRDGRWEVAELLPAVPLFAESKSSASTQGKETP